MKRFTLFHAGLLCAGAAAALSPHGNAQEPMQPSRLGQAMMSDDLKDFYESAASANMLEIETSKLALAESSNPDIRKFAQHMVDDHSKAGAELKSLADSKGVQLPATMLKRHQMMYDDLKDEKRGEEFDQEYRRKMIASHKEAVSLFDKTAKNAKDPEVKALAARLLPKLQHHGGMAKELPKA